MPRRKSPAVRQGGEGDGAWTYRSPIPNEAGFAALLRLVGDMQRTMANLLPIAMHADPEEALYLVKEAVSMNSKLPEHPIMLRVVREGFERLVANSVEGWIFEGDDFAERSWEFHMQGAIEQIAWQSETARDAFAAELMAFVERARVERANARAAGAGDRGRSR